MSDSKYILANEDHRVVMQAQNHYVEGSNLVDYGSFSILDTIASKIKLIADFNDINDYVVINCLLALALDDLDNLDLSSDKIQALGIMARSFYNNIAKD